MPQSIPPLLKPYVMLLAGLGWGTRCPWLPELFTHPNSSFVPVGVSFSSWDRWEPPDRG